MKKVTIVGAGNVGATAADDIARMKICDEIVLLDIKAGVAEGKAIDISQSGWILGFNTKVRGVTNDYKETANSDVVVITSGVPRKPGMTREELVGINASIVRNVAKDLYSWSPDAVFIVVSNPMDTMTYLCVKYLKSIGMKDAETKVIGMGGLLDSARFCYYLSESFNLPITEVAGDVIGGHGDTTMVPIVDSARRAGQYSYPLEIDMIGEDMEKVVADTKVGGAILTSLIGTSAWYAPAAAIARTVSMILCPIEGLGPKPFSVYRKEYGICIGSLAILGTDGVQEILKNPEEDSEEYKNSIKAIKKVNGSLEI